MVGCPPYIEGPKTIVLAASQNKEDFMANYRCINRIGGNSSEWIDIVGRLYYGSAGRYIVELYCPSEKHGAFLDAIPMKVTVNILN